MSGSPPLAADAPAAVPARRYRLPPRLRPGDRVRVVAPCGPFAREPFAAGLGWLREQGLEPVHDDGVFARAGYLAGDDARRLAELEAAIDDREAGALWVARGGYGAMRLLASLDAGRVARRPKWLVGFSDVTALHAVWARAGLAAVHAANVTTLGRWQPGALDGLRALLFEGRGPRLAGRLVSGPGETVSGPLLGGNVALLAALAGTGWLPDLDGAVVLLEDVREPPYRLDRLLTQLLLAGALDRVAGFAVGQLTACDDRDDASDPRRGLDVLCERLAPLGRPLLIDLPIGHGRDSVAVPLGAVATLDGARGELRVLCD